MSEHARGCDSQIATSSRCFNSSTHSLVRCCTCTAALAEGTVIDDTWIFQPNHGPFLESEAPTEVPNCTRTTCKQYDHWVGRLSADIQPLRTPPHALRATDLGAQSVQHIADFRARFGEATWLNEELKQLDEFAREFGGQATFEDTRADGNSDGDWSHQ